MTAAKYGAEELDFRLTFGEDSQPPASGHTDVSADNGPPCYLLSALQQPVFQQQCVTQDSHSQGLVSSSYPASSSGSNPVDSPSRVFDCPSIQITAIPATCQQDLGVQQHGVHLEQEGATGPLMSRDQRYLPLDVSYRDTSTLCPSPCSSLSSRSWLSDASSCESFSHIYDDVEAELTEAAASFRFTSPLVSPQGSPLPSPLHSPQASPQVSPMVSPFGSPGCGYTEDPWARYHQQQRPYSHSLSPHHSPYQSPRTSVNEDTWLTARPHSSSSSKPSSRPTSPYGKRPYSSADCVPGSSSPHLSPTPSPSHSPRGSVTDETWLGSPAMIAGPFQACAPDADIPSKTRRTFQGNQSQDFVALVAGHGDSGVEENSLIPPSLDSNIDVSLPTLKKEDIVEHYLSVPTTFTWVKPKQTHSPFFRSTSLPPLDCSLPCQYGQYELKLDIQPKPHHRAHYETEGSRGAIKSACGRHPIVKLIGYNEKPVSLQMFIGTADERHVRPHAFYQVHRITGKTVATPSQELVFGSTKILEIPLLPENNMSASIDCAGIMKLRNSDIELRKGETDIGRKNTRVRAVFRVHIPQASVKVLSLQTASIPIECSQRSAQELPQIEQFSPTHDSAMGGQELMISGPNITPESKVIFLEKGHDGRTQWEVDAKTVHEKSRDTSIVVKIPPYHKRILGSSVQVQFYVSNGKRKRSLIQRFTYVPAVQVKQEYDSVENTTTSDLSDQFNPLEQWLYSGGPVCVPSSSQHSYSSMDSPYLSRHHPADGSLTDASLIHSIPHSVSLNFSKSTSYQGPQQNISYNGQLALPADGVPVHGGRPSASMPENMSAVLGIGYQNTPVHGSNQVSAQKHNEGYLSPSSGTTQCDPNSPSNYEPPHDPEELVMFPKSSSSLEIIASTTVPSTSRPNREAFINPKSNSAMPVAGTSGTINPLGEIATSNHSIDGPRLDIKQEPQKENELNFQSIGMQDITLDDVSEIIVRDMFQSPDSAPDGCS